MLSVMNKPFILSVCMLSVIMLSVVMLNVIAPFYVLLSIGLNYFVQSGFPLFVRTLTFC